jgi:hypothetical protein
MGLRIRAWRPHRVCPARAAAGQGSVDPFRFTATHLFIVLIERDLENQKYAVKTDLRISNLSIAHPSSKNGNHRNRFFLQS